MSLVPLSFSSSYGAAFNEVATDGLSDADGYSSVVGTGRRVSECFSSIVVDAVSLPILSRVGKDGGKVDTRNSRGAQYLGLYNYRLT